MHLFNLSAFEASPHAWPLWNQGLRHSLQRLNTYDVPGHRFLDVAGGAGWLSHIINDKAEYHLIDANSACIEKSGVANAQVGDCEAMPYEDASFDVVFSLSAAQYMDKQRYLRECLRVLRPGGILALHENGAFNPIIRTIRFWRNHVLARCSSQWREYNDTIVGYLRADTVKATGAEVVYCQPHHVLAAASGVLDATGHGGLATPLRQALAPVDRLLLSQKGLQSLGFMNVYHLRKPIE
jgi:SAM-dependent methyltransferase